MQSSSASPDLSPGFLVLHGDQMEQLRDAVLTWLRQHPLSPLEQEIFLVQSTGVADWLKIAIAERSGVCAATRMMLPARFTWEAYRAMLGAELVTERSSFDKEALAWRLMRLLPELLTQAEFEPLRHFLGAGDLERRWQLAQRLADLFDAYQVYRADWLEDWGAGRDRLRRADGQAQALDAGQRWQASLWRALFADVGAAAQGHGRAQIHQRFVQALGAGAPAHGRLPHRVVLFGVSALPQQTLEALHALSGRCQVVLAVTNPCRFYWADIVHGRDLLRAARRRQPLRQGLDLAALPPEVLHAHGHPLLAAWGKLGRDFIRMLDAFDDSLRMREGSEPLRLELFSEDAGTSLLRQVQVAVRDLLPLDEHARARPDGDDASIEFHIAHGAQREVEILHDRLLDLMAGGSRMHDLRPRDVVVMVPDVDLFAPAIRAVFGRYPPTDARHIPYQIADVGRRRADPLLVALEWLLRLPGQRCLQSEIRDLLDVPALARRFGLEPGELERLGRWMDGAGIRWGLDRQHRDGLGLGAAGEQNTWLFGVRRMLLGYASGTRSHYAGIEAYDEVAGLDAALAGALASLVERLSAWRTRLAQPVAPERWGTRARALMQDFFSAADDADRMSLARLEQALQVWLEDCASAGFDQALPLDVAREAWLGNLDQGGLGQRFVSGGVTFCTLMPMRAVPFRMVCLLGMNDGEFPRRARPVDFDLLAYPGMARPGDRVRRDDDRYLMLEALLAAREKLYVSWTGRSARDNSPLPPSVLVAQLRDYLESGWDLDLAQLTTEHPLQAFSRRYFEQDGLHSYAREWYAVHAPVQAGEQTPMLAGAGPVAQGTRVTLAELTDFVRHPVRHFFRRRLRVRFDRDADLGQDEESFALERLELYQVIDGLLDARAGVPTLDEVPDDPRQILELRLARLARAGRLPLGQPGQQARLALVSEITPVLAAWSALCRQYPQALDRQPLRFVHDGMELDDGLERLRSDGEHTVWLQLEPGRILGRNKPRGDKLIGIWLRQLAAAAGGLTLSTHLVASDAQVCVHPLDPEAARQTLAQLLECWRAGLDQPLPLACRTALALLANARPADVYDGNASTDAPGEAADPYLARLWPSYADLEAQPQWPHWADTLYGPLHAWLQDSVELRAVDAGADQGEPA